MQKIRSERDGHCETIWRQNSRGNGIVISTVCHKCERSQMQFTNSPESAEVIKCHEKFLDQHRDCKREKPIKEEEGAERECAFAIDGY